MPSRTITYNDKVTLRTLNVPEENKVTAADVNSIKTQHNLLDDDVNGTTGALAQIATLQAGMETSSESVLDFQSVYGTVYDLTGTARTGDIEFTSESALIGSKVFIKHNDSSAFSINQDSVIISLVYEGPSATFAEDYQAGTDNYVEFELLAITAGGIAPAEVRPTLLIKARYLNLNINNTGTQIIDADSDTYIDVEVTNDSDQIVLVSKGVQIGTVYLDGSNYPRIRLGDYLNTANSSDGYIDIEGTGDGAATLKVNASTVQIGRTDDGAYKMTIDSSQAAINYLTNTIAAFANGALRLPVPATKAGSGEDDYEWLWIFDDATGIARKVLSSEVGGSDIDTTGGTSGDYVNYTGSGFNVVTPTDIYDTSGLSAGDITNLENDSNWNAIGVYTGTATSSVGTGVTYWSNIVAYGFTWDGSKWNRISRVNS